MTAQTHHPHHFTLELLQIAITRLPPGFSAARKKAYEKRLAKFRKDTQVPFDEIQEAISELGVECWPLRMAYEDMYGRYGRASEEAYLLENLDEGLRAKYERYILDGGKINTIERARSLDDIRSSPFEKYFSPAETFAITQALLAARDSARTEINELVAGPKKDEYAQLVKESKGTQRLIASRIEELRMLAQVSDKWRPDMLERIRTLEEGWSVVERGVNLAEADKEVEHWRGMMETFLKA